jgi:hypothetical protein
MLFELNRVLNHHVGSVKAGVLNGLHGPAQTGTWLARDHHLGSFEVYPGHASAACDVHTDDNVANQWGISRNKYQTAPNALENSVDAPFDFCVGKLLLSASAI